MSKTPSKRTPKEIPEIQEGSITTSEAPALKVDNTKPEPDATYTDEGLTTTTSGTMQPAPESFPSGRNTVGIERSHTAGYYDCTYWQRLDYSYKGSKNQVDKNADTHIRSKGEVRYS